MQNNPIGTFGVDETTGALAPRPSVELYEKLAPVVTISNSNGSSTVSELADVQYTLLDDDDDDDADAETLGAPILLSVATE